MFYGFEIYEVAPGVWCARDELCRVSFGDSPAAAVEASACWMVS